MNKEEYLKVFSKEIHKPAIKKFEKAQVNYNKIDDVWAIDLADMSRMEDNGFKYILVVVDTFSKYCWAIPLKNKTAETVLKGFKSILKGRKPNKIWSDLGSEFKGVFKAFCDKNNIKIYHTYGESKSVIAERMIRTIKRNMWMKFSENQSYEWVEMLNDIVLEYNSTKRRTTGLSPIEASEKRNEEKVFNKLNSKKTQFEGKHKFQVGDFVRISRLKGLFQKGYSHNWSVEVFKIRLIVDKNVPVYYLEDLSGENITGGFFEPELQKTALKDVFLVEKVLETKKRNGVKQSLVKWLGYDKSFNSWINSEDVVFRV